jgi:hypothetical protein
MAERTGANEITMKKGDVLQCAECGLTVTVNKGCDCTGTCDILCCGEEMEPVKK